MKGKVKTRRERERDELRAKILDAARELFLEHGYEAVSMRKIADRIEYTPTTLYNYFEDKDALVLALCDEDFLALRKSFEAVAGIADPVDRLRALGRAYVAFAMAHPGPYRFMFMTPRKPEDPASRRIERGDPDQDAYAFLRATVAEGIAAGRFREGFDDPDLLAQVIWAGVHGLVALHLAKGCDPWIDWRPIERTVGALEGATFRGILRESD